MTIVVFLSGTSRHLAHSHWCTVITTVRLQNFCTFPAYSLYPIKANFPFFPFPIHWEETLNPPEHLTIHGTTFLSDLDLPLFRRLICPRFPAPCLALSHPCRDTSSPPCRFYFRVLLRSGRRPVCLHSDTFLSICKNKIFSLQSGATLGMSRPCPSLPLPYLKLLTTSYVLSVTCFLFRLAKLGFFSLRNLSVLRISAHDEAVRALQCRMC